MRYSFLQTCIVMHGFNISFSERIHRLLFLAFMSLKEKQWNMNASYILLIFFSNETGNSFCPFTLRMRKIWNVILSLSASSRVFAQHMFAMTEWYPAMRRRSEHEQKSVLMTILVVWMSVTTVLIYRAKNLFVLPRKKLYTAVSPSWRLLRFTIRLQGETVHHRKARL